MCIKLQYYDKYGDFPCLCGVTGAMGCRLQDTSYVDVQARYYTVIGRAFDI